ncbi:formate dehydrogenase accessory sulfurtransferase FdhD [Frigidibacter sp.]|uniref:formate dehydrogenase accessory sulfurtransferase FdhD n=1 Tax=Frigidibacter sp. TaxID=2586418 RepID=UPI0027352E4A|nr:formate dehydrogenase accessory sulfurtransferase FdhD [Frigidibacter sp.]MDP3341279.1 formate dehydrogenase accessory sulfurtransferase FdhD [Frigidibacter sp.]
MDGKEARGRAYRAGQWLVADRPLAEEVPVAITVNGTTQAVMMATPADLADFARGFALTEGLAQTLAEIEEVELLAEPQGIEARLWLTEAAAGRIEARRRHSVGPVGCGLCGIESLAEALRPLPRLTGGLTLTPDDVAAAMAALAGAQSLHDLTRAVHGAGFWRPGLPLIAREDVGRHNALDKLAGALALAGIDPASGAVVLTSRLSVDMVQKAAMIGAPLVIAASAPTTLAVDQAAAAGITLIARTRGGEFEVHSHPGRVAAELIDTGRVAEPSEDSDAA